jgi:hypothetical protein
MTRTFSGADKPFVDLVEAPRDTGRSVEVAADFLEAEFFGSDFAGLAFKAVLRVLPVEGFFDAATLFDFTFARAAGFLPAAIFFLGVFFGGVFFLVAMHEVYHCARAQSYAAEISRQALTSHGQPCDQG